MLLLIIQRNGLSFSGHKWVKTKEQDKKPEKGDNKTMTKQLQDLDLNI